ncbi:hypothetical protein [Butyrivibrio sp. M55]|uniref:hypothetical protein n=1 Tax=Butyrivibrio sp. M55 TaxID=1855323 RepID=UPI0008E7C2F2|nr:hypothetical protein [Butyrivibrio sp. M55]SFU90976.1 hypothetical protein SAMN05216540_12026 [Butyrivibrio sp. M55]
MANQVNQIQDFVPNNRSMQKKIGPFFIRNIIEASATAGVIGAIIWALPFIIKAKIIFTLVFCGLAIIFNLIGIRNKSICQVIMLWIRHLVIRRGLRLGSVNDEIKNSKFKQTSEAYRKIRDFWDDKNLAASDETEDTISKQLARFTKQFIRNIADNLG